MNPVLLKPCKGSDGFQGIPRSNMKLNLSKLSDLLSENGYKKKVCVDIIMVVEKNGLELTIYPSGKFLIRSTGEKDTGALVDLKTAEEEANILFQFFENPTL